MEFKSDCGCEIGYPGIGMISNLEGMEDIRPKVIHICEQHKYELLIKYLEMFDTITFALIKRTFRLPESEVDSLLKKIEREDNNMNITIHDFVVTRID